MSDGIFKLGQVISQVRKQVVDSLRGGKLSHHELLGYPYKVSIWRFLQRFQPIAYKL